MKYRMEDDGIQKDGSYDVPGVVHAKMLIMVPNIAGLIPAPK